HRVRGPAQHRRDRVPGRLPVGHRPRHARAGDREVPGPAGVDRAVRGRARLPLRWHPHRGGRSQHAPVRGRGHARAQGMVMRVVGVEDFGGPDALKVFDLPEPHAGPGEVRIRVHAATVNPTDTYIPTGARAEYLQKYPPPYVPGMDAAGVLDEIGEGVQTDLAIGDHVMAIVLPQGSHGGYSEMLVVPVESVARVPAGASDVEASTLPMNGLTARLAL